MLLAHLAGKAAGAPGDTHGGDKDNSGYLEAWVCTVFVLILCRVAAQRARMTGTSALKLGHRSDRAHKNKDVQTPVAATKKEAATQTEPTSFYPKRVYACP